MSTKIKNYLLIAISLLLLFGFLYLNERQETRHLVEAQAETNHCLSDVTKCSLEELKAKKLEVQKQKDTNLVKKDEMDTELKKVGKNLLILDSELDSIEKEKNNKWDGI